MSKFKQWFSRIMIGRYGVDQLTNAMLIAAMVTIIVSMFFGQSIVYYVLWAISTILLVWSYYRIFSKKTGKRYAENQVYLRFLSKITGRINLLKERFRQRKTHRFFRCPGCKQTVRVPRGKGNIRITCPKCSTVFTKKS